MLIIGNPTNIYIASSFEIDFANYFLKMVIPTIITGLSTLFLMLLIFWKKLQEPIQIQEESAHIKNKTLLAIGLFNLLSCTILLAISSYINLSMWKVSLVFSCFPHI